MTCKILSAIGVFKRSLRKIFSAVAQDKGETDVTSSCVCRLDDDGIWNFFKSSYIYILHLSACALLYTVLLLFVDNHSFNVGSPPSLFSVNNGLYQTHINGLISLALVLIRLLGGACSSLLIWRIIFILFEKPGLTLAELSRLNRFRIPAVPGFDCGTRNQLLWSSLMALVVLLLWPPSAAAPLVGSALAWIPSTTRKDHPVSLSIPSVDANSDWGMLKYPNARLIILFKAAAMALSDAGYAFDYSSTNVTLRRYFPTLAPEFNQGIGDLSLPYFDVKLRWIDSSSGNRSIRPGQRSYSDFSGKNYMLRYDGTVEIIRDSERYKEKWPSPSRSLVFTGEKLIAVKVNTIDRHVPLDKDLPCPARSAAFDNLPAVEQLQVPITSANKSIIAKDCYLLGHAYITAGVQRAKNCRLSSSTNSSMGHFATCSSIGSTIEVEPSMLTDLSIDAMSEVMSYYLSLLPQTTSMTSDNIWMIRSSETRGGSLDAYVRGLMTLAYHAIWSSLTISLVHEGYDSVPENMLAHAVVQTVRAEIDWVKMAVWLGMSATLALAAVLVTVLGRWVRVKMVRNAAIAALTVDMGEVCHVGKKGADGLCNAVALSAEDRKLPRLRWGNEEGAKMGRCSCCRKLVFADRVAEKTVRHCSADC